MTLKIFYLDTQNNLLLLEREINQKERDVRVISCSLPCKALIIGFPLLDELQIQYFSNIMNDYEKLFNNYGHQLLQFSKLPISAYREQNEIFELSF